MQHGLEYIHMHLNTFFGVFSRARVPASDQLHEEPFCFIELVLGLHLRHRLHRKSAGSSPTFQIHRNKVSYWQNR